MTGPLFGLPPLDQLLQGMDWGENILWTKKAATSIDEGLEQELVVAALSGKRFAGLLLVGEVDERGISDRISGVDITSVDDVSSAAEALKALGRKTLVVVARPANAPAPDRSGGLAILIARTGAVGYWFDGSGDANKGLSTLAPVILEVDATNIRVERADARGAEVRGAILPYRLGPEGIRVEATSTASLLGRGLRAVRRERGWSQAHLAWMVGVSGSAISQAERGHHAMSLETVLDLADKLGTTVDQLVRGRTPDYGIDRAGFSDSHQTPRIITHGRGGQGGRPALSTAVSRILPRGSSSPGFDSDLTQVLIVGRGMVQAILKSARPLLREGDVLTVDRGGIASCRNVGDDEALVFWQQLR
ncbi:helix-turn-helix domain-containing protein [Gordonia sp. CPCC 205333]|uniref:helix-turn-helix domain-containing protein n=1 Tax=Gordonia sp. CPCC 205333 TaxID=3140790 RepID=UPI003AF3AF39